MARIRLVDGAQENFDGEKIVLSSGKPYILNMSPIRVRVRELREALNLTQEQLAERAGGVRVATISALENGRVGRVELRILEQLAGALGVEPGFLIVREPESRPKRNARGSAPGHPSRGRKSDA
jgi:DNA-binding Xre family transcriptional regulator